MRKYLLLPVYYLLVTPYGLVRRYVRDPLARRWDPKAASYFVMTDGKR